MRGITNAQQKNGVTTINTIAPDANNDFTIEAGTGVTITAGTNKITIDAVGGGGEWTEFTGSLWSSGSFLDENNCLKYDILILSKGAQNILTSGTLRTSINDKHIFIPKGTPYMNNAFEIPLDNTQRLWDDTNQTEITPKYLYYGFTAVSTAPTIYILKTTYALDTVNNKVTLTHSGGNSGTKNNITWGTWMRLYYR